MESGYKVYDVMCRKVHTANCDSNICEVAGLMKENSVGSIVVLKEDSPVGIITEQDIARKVVASGKNPKETVVSEVAEKELISIESNRDLMEAMTLMGNSEIKHLPVIDEGKLLGIITAKDVIRLEPHLIEMMEFKSNLNREEAKKLFSKL
jgi:signal-transduction protein with cAMP-binding, CBS, and nucleotidyltransferase domain